MEKAISYSSIEKFYDFLLKQYDFTLIKKKLFQAGQFESFEIILAGKCFALRYYSDRNFISIEIANNEIEKWFALSFLRDFIYNPDKINAGKASEEDNLVRINALSEFLIKDVDLICQFHSREKYPDTKERIENELRKAFFLKHPSAM